MINKIQNIESFTSKVNIVYSYDKNFDDLFYSDTAQQQIKKIVNNDKNDIVTIYGERTQDYPIIYVNVLKKENGQIYQGRYGIINADVGEILQAYEDASAVMFPIKQTKVDRYLV